MLDWKGDEYTDGADRLLDFRRIGNLLGKKPSEVAMTYLWKHLNAILLAVQRGEGYAWAWETEGGEGLKQRIADARNYLILLAACLDEEITRGK